MTLQTMLGLALNDLVLFGLFVVAHLRLRNSQKQLRREHYYCLHDMHKLTGICLDMLSQLATATGGKRAAGGTVEIRTRVQELFKSQASRMQDEGEEN